MVTVSASYGLGEFVVQGVVTPDEWLVFKPTLATGHRGDHRPPARIEGSPAGLWRGRKGTRSEPIAAADRARFSLTDDDVLTLARWACLIEDHYSRLAGHPQPMDIEWAQATA